MEDANFVYFMLKYLISQGIISMEEANDAVKELHELVGIDLENVA